jgi:carbamate kinase
MRVVIALGGNALLRRGEPLTADIQRDNIKVAAEALAPIICEHSVVISHGNGPQVGLLALQGIAYKADELYPLDILDAETEGMVGYLIEQELNNVLPKKIQCAALLTQIEVDPSDPAFQHPSKPIGPIYNQTQAKKLAQTQNWTMAPDGEHYRRVVPSPRPIRIFELHVIELLIKQNVVVICAGGGGIPIVCRPDGSLVGVEAVIDKDLASCLLAHELKADAFLMLTDVDAVYTGWNQTNARALKQIAPHHLRQYQFATGSMAPKVEAACEFVENTGGIAGIGRLQDVSAILRGEAGTLITANCTETQWHS